MQKGNSSKWLGTCGTLAVWLSWRSITAMCRFLLAVTCYFLALAAQATSSERFAPTACSYGLTPRPPISVKYQRGSEGREQNLQEAMVELAMLKSQKGQAPSKPTRATKVAFLLLFHFAPSTRAIGSYNFVTQPTRKGASLLTHWDQSAIRQRGS